MRTSGKSNPEKIDILSAEPRAETARKRAKRILTRVMAAELGRAGVGECKVRGNRDYYVALGKRSARLRAKARRLQATNEARVE